MFDFHEFMGDEQPKTHRETAGSEALHRTFGVLVEWVFFLGG